MSFTPTAGSDNTADIELRLVTAWIDVTVRDEYDIEPIQGAGLFADGGDPYVHNIQIADALGEGTFGLEAGNWSVGAQEEPW